MDDCTRIETALSALLDGELEAAEALAIRRHLDLCPRCARRLETLEAVRSAVAGLRPEEGAPSVADGWPALERRLRAVDRHDEAPTPRRRRALGRERWKLAAAILAAAILAASLWTVGRRGTGGSPGATEQAERERPASPAGQAPPRVPDSADSPDAVDSMGTVPSVTAAERAAAAMPEPSRIESRPCGSSEDCGAEARRLWPAFPI